MSWDTSKSQEHSTSPLLFLEVGNLLVKGHEAPSLLLFCATLQSTTNLRVVSIRHLLFIIQVSSSASMD